MIEKMMKIIEKMIEKNNNSKLCPKIELVNDKEGNCQLF